MTRAADVVQRSYQLWLSTKARFSPSERQRLFGLTIAIGGVCGLVAVAFHASIRALEHLTIERATAASGDMWIPWTIFVPFLGALIAGVALVYIPGARGSGIPQIKQAYATSVRSLRLRDALGKFGIGVLQIGTGSSLGREGPTVQICSGVAKTMGRLVGISAQNLKLLLPVGAAAGIAAAFNAPIAAVTFTIEEIVGTLDQTLLSGVIVAAALAAVVERSVLGEHPVFSIPQGYGLDHASSLIVYAALGVTAALVSVAFTESLLGLRARFSRSRLPAWFRPSVGGAVTGLLGVAVLLAVQVGGITGGGYEGLAGALTGSFGVGILLILGGAKFVATVFSYASGGAGGIFAPSLFIGAMLGGAFGVLDVYLFGHADSQIGAFALVGMGAVFAGVVRAPITSVLIIIEMTGGYGLTLPLMISNMAAYVLARRLRATPVYEALLEQDGVHLHPKRPAQESADVLTLARVAVDTSPRIGFKAAQSATAVIDAAEQAGRQQVFAVVDDDDRLVGIITLEDLTHVADDPELGELVRAADIMRPAVSLRRGELASVALERMSAMSVRELPVVADNDQVVGFVDEADIARAYLRARSLERADPAASGIRSVNLRAPTRDSGG